jgi:hypothetical protein
VIASGALRGYRDTTIPMVIAAIGYWAIGFAGWLLAFPVGLGATGLWAGLAVGLAIVAVALTVRLYFLARRHSRDAVRATLAPSESAAISASVIPASLAQGDQATKQAPPGLDARISAAPDAWSTASSATVLTNALTARLLPTVNPLMTVAHPRSTESELTAEDKSANTASPSIR